MILDQVVDTVGSPSRVIVLVAIFSDVVLALMTASGGIGAAPGVIIDSNTHPRIRFGARAMADSNAMRADGLISRGIGSPVARFSVADSCKGYSVYTVIVKLGANKSSGTFHVLLGHVLVRVCVVLDLAGFSERLLGCRFLEIAIHSLVKGSKRMTLVQLNGINETNVPPKVTCVAHMTETFCHSANTYLSISGAAEERNQSEDAVDYFHRLL
jgi:hypothetical protein